MTSIFNLVPGLEEKMDSILEKYEKYHRETYGNNLDSEEQLEETVNINTSAYKEATRNSETPKAKQAKNKVEQLFNK